MRFSAGVETLYRTAYIDQYATHPGIAVALSQKPPYAIGRPRQGKNDFHDNCHLQMQDDGQTHEQKKPGTRDD